MALAGGAAGLLVAVWSLNGSVSSIPWDLPVGTEIKLDGRVLLFTFVVAVGTSIVFGLASFWQASKHRWTPRRRHDRIPAGPIHSAG